MGTMALPYQTIKDAQKFRKQLEKPVYVKPFKHDDEVIISAFAIKQFVDDQLGDLLDEYHSKRKNKLEKFDARPVIKQRLKKMLIDEEWWLINKGEVNGGEKTLEKKIEAINILRVHFRLKPLKIADAKKLRKKKPAAKRALYSGIPYCNKRRASGFLKKMSSPWMVNVSPDRYTNIPGHLRANLNELERYYYDIELEKKLHKLATRTKKPFDIRPVVKKEIIFLLKAERATYKKTSAFIDPAADLDAFNSLAIFFRIKPITE